MWIQETGLLFVPIHFTFLIPVAEANSTVQRIVLLNIDRNHAGTWVILA